MITEFKSATLTLRKAKNPLAATMVFHLAEIQKIGKASNKDTTVDEALQYVKKTVGKLKADPYASQDEIVFLEAYLPQMAGQDEIEAMLQPLLAEGQNKGQIMKAVKEHFGVNVDMKLVSQLIK
jgi:hypothetical protein